LRRRRPVGGNAIGEHGVEVKRGADRLGRVRAVAGHHDDPRHARGAKSLDGPRRLAPELVRKQQTGDRAPVNGNEDAEGGTPRCPPQRAQRPLFRLRRAINKLMRPDANLSPLDDAFETGSHGLADLCGNLQREPFSKRRGDNGARHDMVRGLLERGGKPQGFIGVLARSGLDRDQPRSADS